MKPFTFLVIFGSALAVLQVSAKATEAPAAANRDVSVTEDWSDVTSHAMKVIGEGLKLFKSQTDSQVRNDTEFLVGSMNQTLSKLAMETEMAEKDIARFDNTMRDTDQRMTGIRTELNAFAQNVYQYHTEVIGIRAGLENKMEGLESKIDNIAKKITDVNSKVDNGFAENSKEFQNVGVMFADVNKRLDGTNERLDATNERLDDLIKLIQPLIPPTTVKPGTNNLIRAD